MLDDVRWRTKSSRFDPAGDQGNVTLKVGFDIFHERIETSSCLNLYVAKELEIHEIITCIYIYSYVQSLFPPFMTGYTSKLTVDLYYYRTYPLAPLVANLVYLMTQFSVKLASKYLLIFCPFT